MLQSVKKVVSEKRKALFKVLGIVKVMETSTTKTEITAQIEMSALESDMACFPDDIVEDMTYDQVKDLEER